MRRLTRFSLILLAGISIIYLCGFYAPQPAGQRGMIPVMPVKHGGPPQRIVSMAPAITEILFAIGSGRQIKGVTDYCQYPLEAVKIKKVGGFYNPNFEAILAVRPDLVILLPAHREQWRHFQKLRIPTYTVDLNTLTGIMSSIIMLGLICEKESQAATIVQQFQSMIVPVVTEKQSDRKKVMLVINRDYSQSGLRDIYIAGKGDFYDELITMAGGINVYQKNQPKYPKVSAESMMMLQPDIIIELIPESKKINRTIASIREDWSQVPGLKAWQKKAVHILIGDHLVVPGPRLVTLLEEIKQVLNK